jgi:hypothetical protein
VGNGRVGGNHLPLAGGELGHVYMVCAGMFTNNTGSVVITDDVNLRLKAVMRTMTEAEKPNKLMRKDLSATEMNYRGTHGGGHPRSATVADGDDRDGLQA